MRDTELYRHLLGLEEPWTVSRVELNLQEQRVDIWAEHGLDLEWPCPDCGLRLSLYDHAEERVWRHLDSCQFLTYLHAQPPRVSCPQHGVRRVQLPWAEVRARFTALFERLAIDVLKEVGFAVICPLARHRRPLIQFLFIGSRVCSALLSGPASRRIPLRFANPLTSIGLGRELSSPSCQTCPIRA
jgi:hypothetical protein